MEDHLEVEFAEYTRGTTGGKDWKRLYFRGKSYETIPGLFGAQGIFPKQFLAWGVLAEKNSKLAEGDKVEVEADEQEGDYHIVTALKKFEPK